ncbi:MAG TPA: TonB-dependent receptor plug domain-containing protein, partial [Vicinamibacterales bacterium]
MKKMLSIGRRKVRRRGTARLFVVGATVAATAAVSARPAEAQGPATEGRAQTAPAPTFRFDLPAGRLEDVAAMFTRVTGIAITFANPDIAIIQSPGASGTMTAEAAMTALLMGTSVRATFTVQGATLDLGGVSEFVQVSASTSSVSSPKYQVPLRDVAQTIAVIPRKVMDEQGAFTLSDALRNVPGITLQAGEGGGASNTAGDMFNLRGFNASNSLFSDGVRDDGLIARDVYNLEQVEVFMGPTGSDVGRGTAAGYVNMQTKAPHLGSSTNVAYSQGTAAQQRLSADFNWAVPQSQNGGWLSKSAFRVNALWQDAGQPGRDLVTRNSTALAPSVALGLGTPTRVTVSGQVMRQDNLPDYGIPGAAWQEYPLAPTTDLADKPVDQTNFYGSLGYDHDKASQGTVLARVEHDLSRNRTFRNQLRYNRTHREAVVSAIQNVAAFNPVTEMV